MGNNEKFRLGTLTLFTNIRYIRGELEKRRELLYRLAYSWCHNPAQADNRVQDVIVKALKNARQLKNTAAIKNWFGRQQLAHEFRIADFGLAPVKTGGIGQCMQGVARK